MVQIENSNSNNSHLSWIQLSSSRHSSLIFVIITLPQRDRDDNNSSLLTHTDHSRWLFKQPPASWPLTFGPHCQHLRFWESLEWNGCGVKNTDVPDFTPYFSKVDHDDLRVKEAYIALQMVTRKTVIQPIYMLLLLVQNSKSLVNCLFSQCSGPSFFLRADGQLSLSVLPIFFYLFL